MRSLVSEKHASNGHKTTYGMGAPTGVRYMVMTKSLLTGAITCSNSDGMFPTDFKRARFDAIAITSCAETSV